MQVTPSQLTTLLSKTIPAHLPVLVTGMPGIGKSDIIGQAAEAAGADFMVTHPAVSDPTDFKGLPWAEAGADVATFLPFGDLALMVNAKKLLVVLIDDLGQATPAVQAAVMQLLLARQVNGHKLSDNVVFIAATNRRTDRAGVTGLLEPVKSRFAAIVELVTDVDEHAEWALNQPWYPAELVAFHRFRPALLADFKPSADLTNSPLPRTWANAAKILGLGLDPELELAALAGAVGDGAAAELVAFLRLVRELPDIESIIADPENAPIPDSPGTLYAVVTALGSKASVDTFEGISRYAGRLLEAGNGEFATLLARDAIRRDPEITNTQAFVRFATGDFATLLTGGA
jgi:hypothetical protein